MPTDLPAGPDSPPTDELDSAEASLGVLQNVLHPIANEDWSKQTPCREFDIASADRPSDELDRRHRRRRRCGATRTGSHRYGRAPGVVAARPALDAWHRRGLDGTVKFGDNEAPARVMAGILSLEFLVHAWDYAAAMGSR